MNKGIILAIKKLGEITGAPVLALLTPERDY
jgi:hypothetical protein